MFNFLRPIWHELIHNLTLWICCSLKIIVRQGNLIHSQSVPRHSSVSTAKINKKNSIFFVLFWFDFAARNRPVGITIQKCPKISKSERALNRVQVQAI